MNDIYTRIAEIVARRALFFVSPTFSDIFYELQKSNKDINTKIDRAYLSLKETSELINELQTNLTERTDKVKKLKDEYDRYSNLASIEESKIKPLLIQLDQTMSKGKKFERWVSFLINLAAGIIFFFLGVWWAE